MCQKSDSNNYSHSINLKRYLNKSRLHLNDGGILCAG